MEFGPGVAATFLYYFSGTAVVLALVVSRALGLGVDTGLPQQFGAIGGLIAGIVGTYFNRTITFTLPIQSEKQFLNFLESVLTERGYALVEEVEGVRVYQRSSFSQWFSGRVFVQIEGAQATLASRAVTIRSLKQVLA
jgi:hypothetical protein